MKDYQKIHFGEKRYGIVACGIKFGRNGNLKMHQKIHTGEKKHSVQYVVKIFETNRNLKKSSENIQWRKTV